MRTNFTALLMLMLLRLNLIAQDINEYQSAGLFAHETRYTVQSSPTFTDAEEFISKHFQASSKYEIEVLSIDQDDLGFTHYRLKQKLHGIPIVKSMLLVHVKNGKVVSVNGEWFKELPETAETPSIAEEQAFENALAKVKAKLYIWETDEASQMAQLRSSDHGSLNFNKPAGELVYMNADNELSAGSLKLAYKFDIFAVDPMVQQDVYIDASTGKVLFSVSRMHEANVNATASTGYYGSQSITADQSGGTYYARQSGNRRIELYDMNGRQLPQGGSLYGTTISSTSSTFSFSGNKRYYMDAYWGAEVTVDFFREKFNRNSYDGNGGKIDMYVNASGQGASNNAFWYGTFAYFGNASSGTPFTSLDVVSHEITHGVTGNSANLTYQGESGALNESFSDIFGCYAEHYAGVGQKWTMGEYISFQRSMNNPNQHNQPDTYRGSYWASTTGADNGGVHTNSGVMNYWFYLVSEGGSGTNDNGASFAVDAIGIEKAAQVAYRALTRYLTASSGYSAARNAVINAATDLYGANSCELAAVTDAMHAIGVGSQFSGNCGGGACDVLTGLSVSNVGTNSATATWNAVSGISSYTVEYKPTTSSSYTIVTANSASRSLTGLTANTSYNVRVKYTCLNGIEADYATTSFSTQSDSGSCDAVSGLSVSNVTTSGATVTWSAVSGVSSYTLAYKTASATTYTTISTSSSTYSLSGLLSNTSYDVRVNYSCSNGQTAPYANATFTTNTSGGGNCEGLPTWSYSAYYYQGDQVVYNNHIYEALYFIYYYPPTDTRYWANRGECGGSSNCDALTGLSAGNVTANSASLSWNAVSGVTNYTVEYKLVSASSYTIQSVSSNSAYLSGLASASSYTARVKYGCSNGQDSPYVTTSFTTIDDTTPCEPVTGLTATSITDNSAQISWNGVTGVNSYTLEYKETSASTYGSAIINDTSEPFTGLQANTSYTVRVKYQCANGQESGYATHQFTTTGGSSGCDGIEVYRSGKYYFTGDEVVYNGYIYQAQIDYIYWPPVYGWWSYVGNCGNGFAASFAHEDAGVDLTIYPNPATDQINVRYFLEEGAASQQISIIDHAGKVVLEMKPKSSPGSNYLPIRLPNLKPGIYILKLGSQSKQFLIK